MESKAKNATKSHLFALRIIDSWNRIVYAETEMGNEEKVKHFQKTYAKHPQLVTYVQNIWLIHARKFVHAYTNKVLHFGNRTKNRYYFCYYLIFFV